MPPESAHRGLVQRVKAKRRRVQRLMTGNQNAAAVGMDAPDHVLERNRLVCGVKRIIFPGPPRARPPAGQHREIPARTAQTPVAA
jgi:hypothetical protein